MSDVDDLVTWLRAQLDDDERTARAVAERSWTLRTDRDYPTPDQAFPDHTLWLGDRLTGEVGFGDGEIRPSEAEHIARHDPARVLAEVDAKRRILDEHSPSGEECRTCSGEPYMEEEWDGEEERVTWKMVALPWPCPTVRLLALPYADRPGYRDEWKP